jgi:predicted MPP superfamily phosphohydrolase
VAAAALLAAAVGVWAFWLEPRSLRVREHALALPGWPSGLAGLRIAVLSDLHVGSPFNDLAHLRRIVALTNEARPEIVLVTGDLVILGVIVSSPRASARASSPCVSSSLPR